MSEVLVNVVCIVLAYTWLCASKYWIVRFVVRVESLVVIDTSRWCWNVERYVPDRLQTLSV